MIYKIPVVWSVWAMKEIKANSLEEAKQKALDGGLPTDSEYIEDTKIFRTAVRKY